MSHPFHPVVVSDTVPHGRPQTYFIQSISAMEEHKNESFEELRLQDYNNNNVQGPTGKFGDPLAGLYYTGFDDEETRAKLLHVMDADAAHCRKVFANCEKGDLVTLAFFKALSLKHHNVLRAFLNNGFDVNVQEKSKITTALGLALSERDEVAVALLLEYNADVAPSGHSLLVSKCMQREFGMAELLLQVTTGAVDVNARNEHGNTALFFSGSSMTVTTTLLQRKADVNAQNNIGKTPLMAFIHENIWNVEGITLLLENNADPNIQDKDGATALMFACLLGDAVMVELLLFWHADVSIVDKNGNTAEVFASLKTIKDLLLNYCFSSHTLK